MPNDSLPIYLLPGMASQFPVYAKLLPLIPNAHVVPFIAPEPNESLSAYAQRMAPQFVAPCFIGGVSFGGIVAQEISRIVQPAGCVVIASVQEPSQLPPRIRLWRPLGGGTVSCAMKMFGNIAKCVPAHFQTPATARMADMSGTSGEWYRWAVSSVVSWDASTTLNTPLLHIHGSADTTFPVRYTTPDIVIENGRHALSLSHPEDTAAAIRSFIETHCGGSASGETHLPSR